MKETAGARYGVPNSSESPAPRARRSVPLQFWFVAIGVVAFDQLFKLWIRSTLAPGDTISVLPGLVHLSHSHNTGAAWGMFSGQRWFLILVSVAVSAFIIQLARDFAARGVLALSALGLIFGGAIGNLIDRIAFGHVTDMIDVDTSIEFLRTFPVFNVADSALTVGVILLILEFLLHRENLNPEPETQNP